MRFEEQFSQGSERVTTREVVFVRPFTIGKSAEVHPPGAYEVETVEEALEGVGHTAQLRKSTTLIIRTATGLRCLEVVSSDLDDALIRDAGTPLTEPSENPDRENAETAL